MGTPFSAIYDRFYKKLVNDKKFFNYNGLTENEIASLVKDHSFDLLLQAIQMIYENGKPDFDFYDKDDTLETFNKDLVKQEIDLLVEIMYFCYMREDVNKLHVLGLTFKGSELNVFSSANERRTFLDMVNNMERTIKGLISNYLSRDRITWRIKTILR